MPVKTRCAPTTSRPCWPPAAPGWASAVLPWYVARESLADGAVVAVLADFALPTQGLHAVFPSPKLVPGKVSTFIDFPEDPARRRGGTAPRSLP